MEVTRSEYHREWRRKNAVALREKNKLYREKNREILAKKQCSYRTVNNEKILERKRLFRTANKDKIKEYTARTFKERRAYSLRVKYGIDTAYFEALSAQQDHRCAICRKAKKLVVDHCHNKNSIRGLLCTECNKGIGLLGDDVDGLERALAYIRKTPE